MGLYAQRTGDGEKCVIILDGVEIRYYDSVEAAEAWLDGAAYFARVGHYPDALNPDGTDAQGNHCAPPRLGGDPPKTRD